MTIIESHKPTTDELADMFREPDLFTHAVTIARGPSGTIREQALEHILSLYQRGGMTDEDMCEAYRRNAHFFDWPALTDMGIVHLRNELSSMLKLTAVISRGHILHALTGNLR